MRDAGLTHGLTLSLMLEKSAGVAALQRGSIHGCPRATGRVDCGLTGRIGQFESIKVTLQGDGEE